MIDCVKGFFEIQKEHSTDTPTVHPAINISKEVGEASASGVTLSESRLALCDDVVITKVFIQLTMYNTLCHFTECGQYRDGPVI